MQGGVETRPCKITRRVVVCGPTPCVALWQHPRAGRRLAFTIAHGALVLVGAGFKPALAPQSRRIGMTVRSRSHVLWFVMYGLCGPTSWTVVADAGRV